MSEGPRAPAPLGAAHHSERRRALIATALGVGLGIIVRLFAKPRPDERRWRGRSAT